MNDLHITSGDSLTVCERVNFLWRSYRFVNKGVIKKLFWWIINLKPRHTVNYRLQTELFSSWSLIYNKTIKHWLSSGCRLRSLDWCLKSFAGLMMFMYYEGYLLTPNEALAIVFLIFGFYTVVGNVLVFIVYILDPGKKLRRVSNSYFVISLAVADILVGITVEPINAASYWTNNHGVLFSYFIFAVLSCVCSIVNISALMADRFLAVCRPFQYRSLASPNRVRLALLLIWLFSIHFSILPLIGWRSASFQIYLYGLGVLLPATLMLISYYGLLRALKKKMINVKSYTDRKKVTHVKKTVARERRVSTTVFIMLLVFLVAWGPCVIIDFVLVFCESCRSEKLLLARDVTLTIGFFSSGINPGLYAWRVPNFRHGLMLLFQRGIKKKSRLVQVVPLEKDGPSGVMDLHSSITKINIHDLAFNVSKTHKETINSVWSY